MAPAQDRFFTLRLNLLLATLLGFASISTDLFLPALPQMGVSLHATQDVMQYVISAYLIGFAVGQLIWGPLGDKYGRRLPIASGLVLFIIGSGGCALSTNATALIGFRVVQALGACASVVLARAIVRDLYEREQAAKVLSGLLTIMAVAPLIGPSIGGLILKVAPWQAIFWLLVVIALATLVMLFTIPESLSAERRNTQSLGAAFVGYASLLGDKRLLIYCAVIGFFYSAIFANISSTSFAFVSYHHVSPQGFGIIFAIGIVGLMLANSVNAKLVGRFGSDKMLLLGAAGAALFGLNLVLVTFTDLGGYMGLAVSMWVFTAMNGFINANAVSGAMAYFPTRAGAASALIGAFQYGSGVVGSAAAGYMADGTPRPMAVVMFASGVGCLACAILVRKAAK